MVLQAVASSIYLTVEASWQLSTYVIPLFLAAEAVRSYINGELSGLGDTLFEDSRPVVIAIVLLGAASNLLQPSYGNSGTIGSLITVTFYGYLFWRF